MKLISKWVCALIVGTTGFGTSDTVDKMRLDMVRSFVAAIPDSVLTKDNVVAVAVIQGDQDALVVSALKSMFTQDSRFGLTERQEAFFQACQSEIILGMSDYIDRSAAARLGRVHGAEYLVMGKLWQLESNLIYAEASAELELVHTETARVLHHRDRGELRRRQVDTAAAARSGGVVFVVVVLVLGGLRSRRKSRKGLERGMRGGLEG